MKLITASLSEHRARTSHMVPKGAAEMLALAPGGSTTCFGSSSTTTCCAVVATEDRDLGLAAPQLCGQASA